MLKGFFNSDAAITWGTKFRLVAKLRQLLANDYLQDLLKLVIGTGFAQLIPILASPILTRLYSPRDFGLYTVFISIAYIFGPIICGCYEKAIVITNSIEERDNVVYLSVLVSLTLSILFLLLQFIFKSQFAHIFRKNPMGFWFYWLPLVIFMMGILNILNNFFTRQKQFKSISQLNVFKSTTSSFSQVFIGLFRLGPIGLFAGQIGACIATSFIFFKTIKKLFAPEALKKVSLTNMLKTAKRYSHFPLYSSASALLNAASFNVVNIFIGIIYSAHNAGFMLLVTQIIGLPTSLLARPLFQVLLQRASEEKKISGNAKQSFSVTFKSALFFSVIMFTFLFFLSTPLVKIAFGKTWLPVATYIKILIPFFAVRFFCSIFSAIIIVFEKNRVSLLLNAGLSILILFSFFIDWYFSVSFEKFLFFYSFLLSVWYIVVLFYYYRVACKSSIKVYQ